MNKRQNKKAIIIIKKWKSTNKNPMHLVQMVINEEKNWNRREKEEENWLDEERSEYKMYWRRNRHAMVKCARKDQKQWFRKTTFQPHDSFGECASVIFSKKFRQNLHYWHWLHLAIFTSVLCRCMQHFSDGATKCWIVLSFYKVQQHLFSPNFVCYFYFCFFPFSAFSNFEQSKYVRR